MDDELADVPVIGRADLDLVVILDKDRVLEGVPHAAVLIFQANAIRGNQALAASSEDALALIGHVHHLKRIDVNVEDVWLYMGRELPVFGGIQRRKCAEIC